MLARSKTYLIVIVGNRADTLEKEWGSKLNSIEPFAPGQVFFTHPAFFENSKQFQAAPDQEIQLPEYETYLIVIVHICAEALVLDSTPKLNSIEPFASGQLFRVLLVFGGPFWLVITCYLLVIQLLEPAPLGF